MSRIFDVTMPLRPGMLVYPGTPPFEWEMYRRIAQGDSSNNSRFSMGTHTGTHVDAPAHYVDGGATISGLSPEVLIGPCRVFRHTGREINAEFLRGQDLNGVSRALFATPSSARLSDPEFDTEFAHVTADGAECLRASSVKLVGVDYLSVDRYKAPGHPAHHTLLGAGIVVIEGLDLSSVEPGDYELICCPLRMDDSEAAPARVFLREV